MNTFNYTFIVNAPLTAVSAFHSDTSALKKLSPPLTFVQLHKVEPLAEGSISEFTLWFGPLPVRWRAIHSGVSERGFTDTQLAGPAAHWQHNHTFTPLNPSQTEIREHIEYDHKPGMAGLFTRFMFAPFNLRLLFRFRQWATARGVE
jgi:ligand-binding SRPBCC domain-containing protein